MDRQVKKRRGSLLVASMLLSLLLWGGPAAAEAGKFQVVPGSGEMAYLVDTTTGAVWVLTYRTLATGREPIAIPYKFIRLSPKNQGEFLVESAGDSASMPPSSGRQ